MAINDLEVSYEGYANVWDSYPLQGIAHNCGLMHKPFTHWKVRNNGGKVQVKKSLYFMRKLHLRFNGIQRKIYHLLMRNFVFSVR